MRKVVAFLFISLDGVVEAPNVWQGDLDEDMVEDMTIQIALQNTAIMGRMTYLQWFQYWPTSDHEPFASFINQSPKYIVSTSLQTVEWGKWKNATLIQGNLSEQLGRLKQQPGKNIGVWGSPGLVQYLMQLDLLDELHLWLHPVLAGKGGRLFREGEALKRLKLASSKTTRTGILLLTYQFPRTLTGPALRVASSGGEKA